MNRSAVRREFRSAIWPHERGSAGSSWLGGSDDEGLASGLDDVAVTVVRLLIDAMRLI
jgi:hypothetical protein